MGQSSKKWDANLSSLILNGAYSRGSFVTDTIMSCFPSTVPSIKTESLTVWSLQNNSCDLIDTVLSQSQFTQGPLGRAANHDPHWWSVNVGEREERRAGEDMKGEWCSSGEKSSSGWLTRLLASLLVFPFRRPAEGGYGCRVVKFWVSVSQQVMVLKAGSQQVEEGRQQKWVRHLRSLPRGFEKSRSVRESLSVKERSTKSGHHPLSTSSVSAGIERGISYEGGGGGGADGQKGGS